MCKGRGLRREWLQAEVDGREELSREKQGTDDGLNQPRARARSARTAACDTPSPRIAPQSCWAPDRLRSSIPATLVPQKTTRGKRRGTGMPPLPLFINRLHYSRFRSLFRLLSQAEDDAQCFSGMHQIKRLIDLVQREVVCHKFVDHQLLVQVLLH